MALADRTIPFITSKEANKITFFIIVVFFHSTSGKSEYLIFLLKDMSYLSFNLILMRIINNFIIRISTILF